VKSEFERAVELDSRSIDARHGLIQFYSQAPGVMGGSMDKARDQAREIAKINPMRGHFELANLAARDKKLGEAEQEYLAAERDSPDSTIGGTTLAAFYLNQGRWADAFAAYDRLEKRFPDDTGLRFQIGRASAISGEQLPRGERAMKSWLAAPPTGTTSVSISNGHWRLGMIYEKQGRRDAARGEYNEAMTIWSANENAKKSLAAMK
jgi:tetratricopeptide (TPR) repeat protein